MGQYFINPEPTLGVADPPPFGYPVGFFDAACELLSVITGYMPNTGLCVWEQRRYFDDGTYVSAHMFVFGGEWRLQFAWVGPGFGGTGAFVFANYAVTFVDNECACELTFNLVTEDMPACTGWPATLTVTPDAPGCKIPCNDICFIPSGSGCQNCGWDDPEDPFPIPSTWSVEFPGLDYDGGGLYGDCDSGFTPGSTLDGDGIFGCAGLGTETIVLDFQDLNGSPFKCAWAMWFSACDGWPQGGCGVIVLFLDTFDMGTSGNVWLYVGVASGCGNGECQGCLSSPTIAASYHGTTSDCTSAIILTKVYSDDSVCAPWPATVTITPS